MNNSKQQKKSEYGKQWRFKQRVSLFEVFLKNNLTEYSLFLFSMVKMFLPLSVVDAKGRPICVSSGFEL